MQQRLGLIFMDIHLDALRTPDAANLEFASAFLLVYHIPEERQIQIARNFSLWCCLLPKLASARAPVLGGKARV
jgi:hypothetical protein